MGNPQSKIRVVIADDHPIYREGLAQVIGKSKSIEIVASADNGADAVKFAIDNRPNVVVLDVAMPQMDGIEAARKLSLELPEVEIIFLTMHKNRSILQAMAPIGVKGYLLKDAAMNEIVHCIEMVMSGKSYLSPSLSDLIIGNVEVSVRSNAILEDLTETEAKILRQISKSKTTKEIAAGLNVSIRTIETHRHNICLKLGLTGPHALFKFAHAHASEIDEHASK